METGYEKPTVKLIGTDGNVFALIGLTSDALKKIGRNDLARQFRERALNSESYYDVLCLIEEYVEIT